MEEGRREIRITGRRQGKRQAAMVRAEAALDDGKSVVVLGRDGKPIIPSDWAAKHD